MKNSPVLRAYLNPDNQTLLWSIIIKHELFHQVLTEPEIWFQSILEMFFTQSTQNEQTTESSTILLYEQLKTMNQKTLLYMVQDLQKRGTSFPRNNLLVQSTSISGVIEQETKMMFSMEKDEPIKNFDEIILEQQQMRENQNYFLPQQPPPLQNTVVSSMGSMI